jgi:hypothetical protein
MLDEDSIENEGKKLFGPPRFSLIFAGAWLQLMVAIFVIVQTLRRVYTPVTDWLNKIFYLLGL